MTRNPIDYSKTVFYKIVCKDLTITDLYVGATTDFKSRKNNHKTACNNSYIEGDKYHTLKVYTFIRDNGGWDNWDMVMIHRESCVDKLEADKIERGFMETIGATLNSNVPSRSVKENNQFYYAHNKEKIQQYYIQNKDKINERNRLKRSNTFSNQESLGDLI
jgi:hypothetical protein